MKLSLFVLKKKNRISDWDGVLPSQCMDLAHEVAWYVYGIEDLGFLTRDFAKNVWWNYSQSWNTWVTKIANTPTNHPKAGDFVIWDGGTGHIAVCLDHTVDPSIPDPNINTFYSFDANWPAGSLPHIQNHNYTLVLGWLEPKPGVTDMQRLEILWREAAAHGWNLSP